ncbi:MAG: hypothetical protein JRG92_21675 [Deltaproteobacteria bacterium]|nr:hypothetical protein [Deltaproteobacteria bacterium]
MEQSPTRAAPPSPDWLIRPFEVSKLAPAWLGLGLAIAWLGIAGLAHTAAHFMIGPAALPFGPARFASTHLLDAALVGLLLAGQAHLYLGAISDLRRLRPLLPGGDVDFERLIREVPSLSTRTRTGVTIFGIVCGVAVATLDPNLRDLHDHLSRADPRYLIFILQNVLFGTLGFRLFAAEVHMTRAYARLGERIEVDLFDQSILLVFARKGLRSLVVWVLISSALSMFWVLDSAGQANVTLAVGMLALMMVALISPTRGVHLRIAAAKAAELARVTDAIRLECAASLAPRGADALPEDARLGNLIQYQQFVKSIREWPFDLSIVARSVLLILLGAGSWLGGAVVERLLGLALD